MRSRNEKDRITPPPRQLYARVFLGTRHAKVTLTLELASCVSVVSLCLLEHELGAFKRAWPDPACYAGIRRVSAGMTGGSLSFRLDFNSGNQLFRDRGAQTVPFRRAHDGAANRIKFRSTPM